MRIRALLVQRHPLAAHRPRRDLVVLSALILFLAQVCLRWFPEQVVELSRFPKVVLLACLLGTALGCVAAGRGPRLITWTPLGLALALILATNQVVGWANQSNFPITEAFPGLFFVLIALILAGPGQELGRALDREPNRLLGFTLIVLGSAAGILLFAACTYAEFGAWWWFLAVVLGLAYFGNRRGVADPPWLSGARLANLIILAGILGLIGWTSLPLPLPGASSWTTYWSPYTRIRHIPGYPWIGPQYVRSTNRSASSDLPYLLPYLLNRDAAGQPFHRVLVIGAGAGNEVSQALRWGADSVDAVEADPVILRLGQREHPDHPYQDPRVHVHLGDGRHFLRSQSQKYDLILYAFADWPIPPIECHDIRRVSYLLTRQAFAEVRRHLSPHGLFVLIGQLRWGWVAASLRQGLEEVFPEPPLLLPVLYRQTITPDDRNGFVLFFAGNIGHIRQAFRENSYYHASRPFYPSSDAANGFMLPVSPLGLGGTYGLATLDITEYLDTPEDDWPFLFLRRRMIPNQVSRDLILLSALSLLLLWAFRPVSPFPPFHPGHLARRTPMASGWPPFRLEMFCWGAGFMLTAITTRVDTTLLLGDTWMIESTVGLMVLALLLAGLGLVLALRPARLWPLYAGLLAALLLHRLFPLDYFLEHGHPRRAVGSYLLGLASVAFAGMIFTLLFRRSPQPARDVGAVLAGAVLGGMAGSLALVWGFHSLLLLALGGFAVAAVPSARRALWEYDRRLPFRDMPAWPRPKKWIHSRAARDKMK